MRRLRVVVLGEGKDEHGAGRTLPRLAKVPKAQQGALEILVRRGLYEVCKAPSDPQWHAGLDDAIDILEPPLNVGRRSRVEILNTVELLKRVVVGALKPLTGEVPADLFVAAGDGDTAAKGFLTVVAAVQRTEGAFPVLVPTPHIQAWLTSKRAVELVYEREHCTVPEVVEAQLQAGAKDELKRLLASFGEHLSAARQARLAERISDADLARFPWTQWAEAKAQLEAAVLALPGP